MKLYHIKDNYITYLRNIDKRVFYNKLETRPYVGVVIQVGEMKYYAPLSSPKEKHKHMKNAKDFRKINGGLYGVINFNNMIPVIDEALILIDIEHIQDKAYKRLLQNQYRAIKKDKLKIVEIATALRTLVCTDGELLPAYDQRVKQRCCDFLALEEGCRKFRMSGL